MNFFIVPRLSPCNLTKSNFFGTYLDLFEVILCSINLLAGQDCKNYRKQEIDIVSIIKEAVHASFGGDGFNR